MVLLTFYRAYLAIAAGGCVYFLACRHWWVWMAVSVATRSAWFIVERLIREWLTARRIAAHIDAFTRDGGPYGVRVANMAKTDRRIRSSIAEVFVSDRRKLRRTLEQLEMMETLFRAGMRPQGDDYLVHDLKLKYARKRLEENPSPA